MTVVSRSRSGSVIYVAPFVSEAQRYGARSGSSIARQREAGGEGEEDGAGRAIEPADQARPPQRRGERPCRGDKRDEPDEAEGGVDGREQQRPGGDVASRRDELRKEGHVE